jgi:hypothetical protein
MVATLTPHGVRVHFRAAKLAGIPFISLCDICCNSRGVALFASAYRHWRMQRGFPDPGNLCASCAAIHERIGFRLDVNRHAGRGPSKVLPEGGDW